MSGSGSRCGRSALCLAGLAVLSLAACGGGSSTKSPVGSSDASSPEVTIEQESTALPPESSDDERGGESDTTLESVPDTGPSGSDSTDAPIAPSATQVTTTAPLTGLTTTDDSLVRRPALIVKIDGHFGARPQYGLDQADVVIEEIVEGITRFMAVFHSSVPDVVGPVRSARTQDMLIAPMFDHPLFAWSGGNRKVTALVKKSPVVNLSATSGPRAKGMWYRTKKRKAPHNLLARGPLLLERAPQDSKAPPPIFSYRPEGATPAGREVSGVKLVLSSTRVLWMWDPKTASWSRTSDRKPHLAEGDVPIRPVNVVVLEVRYRPSEADPNSPEAQTVGTGKALVFSGGRLVVGTWSRASVADPWTLTDNTGQAILLTPGRTWVELARASRLAIVDVGVDPASVPWKTK